MNLGSYIDRVPKQLFYLLRERDQVQTALADFEVDQEINIALSRRVPPGD